MTSKHHFFEELEKSIVKYSSPGIRPGLDRIAILLKKLGNPQNSFNAVHVVGTNGKGSTSVFLSNIFISAGYKTATYTSPHLSHLGERLVLDGHSIDKDRWIRASVKVFDSISSDPTLKEDPPSFFETLTAISFLLIAEANVDIAVIEAGMGGRLDATNLMGNIVLSVFTPVSLDHSEFLGPDLISIATEKFAVIRENGNALYFGGNKDLEILFEKQCMKKKCTGTIVSGHISYSDIRLSLDSTEYLLNWNRNEIPVHVMTSMIGFYQVHNSSLAVIAALQLQKYFTRIDIHSIKQGIRNTRWPGRMEIISHNPTVILDGAHNEQGVKALVSSLNSILTESARQKMLFVFTSMSDKDYRVALELLSKSGSGVILTQIPDYSRCESAEELLRVASLFRWSKKPRAISDPFTAVRQASLEAETVVICGSLYLVGLMIDKLKNDFPFRD